MFIGLVLKWEKNIITIFLEVTDISSQSAYPLFPTSAQGENNIKKSKRENEKFTTFFQPNFHILSPTFLLFLAL